MISSKHYNSVSIWLHWTKVICQSWSQSNSKMIPMTIWLKCFVVLPMGSFYRIILLSVHPDFGCGNRSWRTDYSFKRFLAFISTKWPSLTGVSFKVLRTLPLLNCHLHSLSTLYECIDRVSRTVLSHGGLSEFLLKGSPSTSSADLKSKASRNSVVLHSFSLKIVQG